MALSKLCKVARLSPNCSRPRNHVIDRLTYHHMAGRLTAESCLSIFASTSRQASSNYVIGYDGTIGGCVEDLDRLDERYVKKDDCTDMRSETDQRIDSIHEDVAVATQKGWTVA